MFYLLIYLVYTDSKNDPAFVNDISMLWRMLLAEDISVAAFVDNPVGGKPIIAGMNVLGVSYKDFDPLSHITVSSQCFSEI